MAINFKTPAMSFVSFSEETENTCSDDPGMCLPLHRLSELSFQVSLTPNDDVPSKPLSTAFKLALCKQCGDEILDEVGNLTWENHPNGIDFVGFSNWTTPSQNLGSLLDNKECFQICITTQQNVDVITGYRWDLSSIIWPISPASVSINGVVAFTGGTYDDLEELAVAIDDYLGSIGETGLAYNNPSPGLITGGPTQDYGDIEILFDEPPAVLFEMVELTAPEEETVVIACSNCFSYRPNDCYSTPIQYVMEENNMGMVYFIDDGDGNNEIDFVNKVRLPFWLKNPVPKGESGVSRLSNGVFKKRYAVVELEYEGEVEWVNALFHQRLACALQHDTVTVTLQDGSVINIEVDLKTYEVDWSSATRGTPYPLAPAEFKATDESFFNVNSNCR